MDRKSTLIRLTLPLLCALPLFMGGTAMAQSPTRHEVRFMLGDMASETVAFHSSPHRDYTGGQGTSFKEDSRYRYTPHYGVSYTFKINRWLGVGALLDCQNTWWTRTLYSPSNTVLSSGKENFFNLSLLPTVRFSYIDNGKFNLYSSLMYGAVLNGGSEVDTQGRKTVLVGGGGVTLLGGSYRWGDWGVAAEVGLLAALKNSNMVYMVGTRLLSVGVSYNF